MDDEEKRIIVKVPSRSNPGRDHEVEVTFACDCEGSAFRKGNCRHARLAKNWVWKRRGKRLVS